MGKISHKLFVFIICSFMISSFLLEKARSQDIDSTIQEACDKLQKACDDVIYKYYIEQFVNKLNKDGYNYEKEKLEKCDNFPPANAYCKEHIFASDPQNKYTYIPDPAQLKTCQGTNYNPGSCPTPGGFFKKRK